MAPLRIGTLSKVVHIATYKGRRGPRENITHASRGVWSQMRCVLYFKLRLRSSGCDV